MGRISILVSTACLAAQFSLPAEASRLAGTQELGKTFKVCGGKEAYSYHPARKIKGGAYFINCATKEVMPLPCKGVKAAFEDRRRHVERVPEDIYARESMIHLEMAWKSECMSIPMPGLINSRLAQ